MTSLNVLPRLLALAVTAKAIQVHDHDLAVSALQEAFYSNGNLSLTSVQDSSEESTQRLHLALRELWSGAELGRESSFAVLNDMLRSSTAELGQGELAGGTKLALMGPFDSGTHLMLYSLIANWPKEMQRACLSPGALEPGQEPQMCRHIWKHSLVDKDGVYRVLRRSLGSLQDTVLLILVRSPVSQVLSWKRDPWDLGACLRRPWEEMDQPCKADMRAKPPASFAGIPKDDVDTFESTADVYNRYMRLYSKLASEGLFKAVKIVAYEEMVTSPSEILDSIAATLDWPKPDSYRILDGSQKNELGTSRADAFTKIRNRTYLVKVGTEGVQKVCQGIDSGALAALPASVTGFSKVYAQDCNPAAMAEAEAASAK